MTDLENMFRRNKRRLRRQGIFYAMIEELPVVLGVVIAAFIGWAFILVAFGYSMSFGNRVLASFGVLFMAYPIVSLIRSNR